MHMYIDTNYFDVAMQRARLWVMLWVVGSTSEVNEPLLRGINPPLPQGLKVEREIACINLGCWGGLTGRMSG